MTERHAAAAGGKRQVAIAVAGWVLVLAGVILLFLPGPGVPLLFAGLALLGRERPWARRLLAEMRRRGGRILGRGEAPAPERASSVDRVDARAEAGGR